MGRKNIYFSIACVFCFTFLEASYAQPPDLSFRHIDDEDGLLNNTINCIFQDSKGYIWLGTDYGLHRYDGQNIRYFVNTGDTFGLTNPMVQSIAEAPNGNIWIATPGGVNRFNPTTESFKHYISVRNGKNSFNLRSSFYVNADKDGTIWFSVNRQFLTSLNPISHTVKQYTYKQLIPEDNDTTNEISTIYIDPDNNVWVGLFSKYLSRLDSGRTSFQTIELLDKKHHIRNEFPISSIVTDDQNNLWAASNGSGLFKVIELPNNHYSISNYSLVAKNIENTGTDRIKTMYKSSLGGLWISYDGYGLFHLDPSTLSLNNYPAHPYNPLSLSSNLILSILEDKEQGLWVGTFSKGVSYSSDLLDKIYSVKKTPDSGPGLSHHQVTAFVTDHKDLLWIGTDGGGINQYIKTKNSFKIFNEENSPLKSNNILDITEDSQYNLWVATWAGGITKIDKSRKKFKTYTNKNSNLKGENFRCIREDKNGTIWIGALRTSGGLSYLKKGSQTFYTYTTKNSNLPDNNIYDILIDHKQNLWLATFNGLSYFNPRKETFKTYYFNENDLESGPPHKILNCLLESQDSTIWLGSSFGLSRFNHETKRFTHYRNDIGVYSSVRGILEDSLGNLWLSLRYGIIKFNPQTNFIDFFTEKDGLQAAMFIRQSHYESPDGIFYFGGYDGYNYFDPLEVRHDTIVPEIQLTEFKLFNKSVPISTDDSPLNKHINELDKLTLSYDDKVFSIDYVALNYANPEKIRYAYMLEGLDTEWNYVEKSTTAKFTNLPPGEYTFRVKVPFNEGIANEKGISLPIKIKPPYWMTWWFIVSVIFAMILLVISISYLRIRQTRITNRKLEKKVADRTKQLQEKNTELQNKTTELNELNNLLKAHQKQIETQSQELKEQHDILKDSNAVKDKLFSIIAHDLKSPFGSLVGLAKLLKRNYDVYEPSKIKTFINLIYDSSNQTYALLTTLLDWARSQKGTIEFNPGKNDIIKIMDENIDLLKNHAINKKVELINITEIDSLKFTFDSDLIKTVLRNLISNAIKFTPAGGKVETECTLLDQHVKVSVKDSGIGISPDNLKKLFSSNVHYSTPGTAQEKGTGLGLIICIDFIKMHKGEIWAESQEGKGSIFYFTLPFQK